MQSKYCKKSADQFLMAIIWNPDTKERFNELGNEILFPKVMKNFFNLFLQFNNINIRIKDRQIMLSKNRARLHKGRLEKPNTDACLPGNHQLQWKQQQLHATETKRIGLKALF